MAKPGEPGDVPDPEQVLTVVDRPAFADPDATEIQPSPAAGPLPGATVGRYVVQRILGEGGMGVVWAAHDPELDRRVALKLLRLDANGSMGSTEAHDRFEREARAMAKLNHPNVVTIYDSGDYGDQVFLTMELVEGRTLKAWMDERLHPWREVLDVFLKAGRGLAAAHAAGLIHRDFKPANVLLGKGGEVKVTDFGLVRATVGGRVEDDFGKPITKSGVVNGTPGYMAPEQLMGNATDERTDEFSFCVALYKALYGERPFPGETAPLLNSDVQEPPKGSQVPLWVRKIVLRGLSIRPEERYGSLPELLDVLANDPAGRERKLRLAAGGVALAVAVGVGVAVLAARQRAADPCHQPEQKLAGVWDATVRARVQQAFVATGSAEAAAAASYAEKAMDRASAAWLAAYRDACDATRVRHAQPETALALRLDCLDDQRLDLRAATEILSHPDAARISSAVGVAGKLPRPSECADARALSAVEWPSPELRHKVEALRLQLAQGLALLGAARFDEAADALKQLPEAARALEDRPLQAKALDALGRADRGRGEYKKAVEFEAKAESLADAAHMDELSTAAAAAVAYDKALVGSPRAEVDAALDRARADLRRAGPGGAAEYEVERTVVVVESVRGHFSEAAAHGRRALDLAYQLFGADSEEAVSAANNLAGALEPLGQYDQQTELLRRAVAAADQVLGPKNQRALVPQVNLAEALFDLERWSELDQVLASLFARLGSEERVQAAAGLAVQSAVQATRGQTQASLKSAGRAFDMAAKQHLLSSPNFVDLHRYTAEAYLRDGQPKLALDRYEKYLARQEIPPDSPAWVAYLRLGGWAYLDAGQPKKALPVLERALKLSAAHPFYPGWTARLRYQLARALLDTRGDRKRAESLAQAAHDELANDSAGKGLLAEVDAWRAKAFKPSKPRRRGRG